METGLELTGKPAVVSASWSAAVTAPRPASVLGASRGRSASVSPALPAPAQAQPSIELVRGERVGRSDRRRPPVGAPTYLISTGRQDRVISELEAVLVAAGWSRNGRNPQVVLVDGRGGVDRAANSRRGSHRLLLVGPGDDPTPLIESGAVDDVHYLDNPRDLQIRLDLAARALVARQQVACSLADARRRAEVDPLTTLGNRRSMDKGVKAALRCAQRGTPGALLLIDVDHFKRYNDRYGHPAGDKVLRRLGETIGSALRDQTDGAYRYGGEEFLVLLSGTEEREASLVAERIRAAVEARAIEHLDNPHGWVTISVGLVALPPGIELDGADAIGAADAALYAAKRAGRNRVCVASSGGAAALSLSGSGH